MAQCEAHSATHCPQRQLPASFVRLREPWRRKNGQPQQHQGATTALSCCGGGVNTIRSQELHNGTEGALLRLTVV